MIIIEKTFVAFRQAFLENKPQGLVTRLFLQKNGEDIPIYGARATDNILFVMDVDRNLILVEEGDTLYIQS